MRVLWAVKRPAASTLCPYAGIGRSPQEAWLSFFDSIDAKCDNWRHSPSVWIERGYSCIQVKTAEVA